MNRTKWHWTALLSLPLAIGGGFAFAKSSPRSYTCPINGEQLPCANCCPLNAAQAESTQPEAEGAKIQELLKERLATLQALAAATKTQYLAGKATFAEVAQANAQLLKAQLELCASPKERLAIHGEAVALAKQYEISAVELYKAGKAPQTSALAATVNRLEAEIAFERAKAQAAGMSK